MSKIRTSVLGILLLLIAGCTGHTPFRTKASDSPCPIPPGMTTTAECAHRMWERIGNDYDMLYVEFDDMGLLYPKERKDFGDAWDQIEQTMQILRVLAKQSGISLVVYVHGWKHNASADDENVKQFHEILRSISLVEQAAPPETRRRVVGVYVGWRGLSVKVEPLKEASFWTRKTAALHVAQGSARHFLARLRAFQRTQNCEANPGLCNPKPRQTDAEAMTRERDAHRSKVRMVVIGHSFGGLIVFNAISEYLVESLTEEGLGSTEASQGAVAPQRFGDMVILLNPAFEAIRYTPLHRVATRRRYTHYQAPLLVLITSTADVATKVFFKMGRHINTAVEHKASEEESVANVNTPGHVEAYLTHTVTRNVEMQSSGASCQGWNVPTTAEEMKTDLRLEAEAAQMFFAEQASPGTAGQFILKDGWTRRFCGQTVLKHLSRSPNPDTPYGHNDPNSPIWNVETDSSLVAGHNDVNGAFLATFIRQLYHDSASFPALK